MKKFLRQELLKRRPRKIIQRKQISDAHPGVFFLWLLFLAALFYIIFFSEFFRIGAPRITGMNKVSEEVLRGFVEEGMQGKFFGVFPKNNFFLVRPRVLEESLLKEYPLLSSVNITRVFPDGLRAEVTEREKILLWCYGAPEQCFLIDEEGRTRDGERALLSENAGRAVFITDLSGKPVTVGEKVFEPGYGKFVLQLQGMFEERFIVSLAARLATTSRFADEVRAVTSEGWEVYFNADVPLESSLNALSLLLAKELPPEKRAKLKYIDLRTENRAYYAFREEENAENPETVTATEQSPTPETKKKKKK